MGEGAGRMGIGRESFSTSGLYVRQSSGLVRELGMGSNIIMTLALMSVPYGALIVTQIPFAYPGANLILVGVVAAVLALVVVGLWGYLAQAMPRSGGDYIFVSRIVHPLVGFMASFNIVMWILIIEAELAAFVAPFGLGSALASIGAASGNDHFLQLATTVSSKNWQFGLGAVTLLLVVVLLSFSPRTWIRLFAPLFFLSIVGVMLAIGLMWIHTRADFQAAVTQFDTTYGKVLSTAHSAGYSYRSGFSLSSAVGGTAVALSFFAFVWFAAYVGGELRSAKRSVVNGMLAALGIATVVMLLLLGGAARTFGHDFLGSATYLGTFVPQKYPFAAPALVFFFASILTKNTVLIAIINFSFALATAVTVLPAVVAATRGIFAWAFDRVIPDRAAEVSPRTNSPLVANGIALVVMLAFLWLIVYGSARFLTIAFTGILAQIPTFIVVALAAVMFPLRPQLYELSPLSTRKVLGVPLISVIGMLALIVYVVFALPYLTNDTLGANSSVGLTALVVIALIGAPIYGVSYYLNRRRDVDLSLAFTQLPPE